FTVPKGELNNALRVLTPIASEMGAELRHADDVSKVSAVGTGMRYHTGVAERMFAALSAEGVNMQMITTADIKNSGLVDRNGGPRALRSVHQAFALHEPRPGAGKTDAGGAPLYRPRPSPRAEAGNGKDLVARLQSSMEDIVVSAVQLNADYGQITVFGL